MTRHKSGQLNEFVVDFISAHDYLSREEEQHLARIIQNENSSESERVEARNTLVSANYRFARSVIKSYDLTGVSLEYADLFQHAVEGLMKAATKFKPGRGKFCTYAKSWILAKIAPAIKGNLYCVKMTSNTKHKVETVLDLSNSMSHIAAETLSPMAVAESCGYDLREIETGLRAMSYVPLEATDIATYDNIEYEVAMESQIKQVRDSLTDFEYDLLARSFGINCEKQASWKIGNEYCISGQRVRVIVTNTLKKIKALLDQ